MGKEILYRPATVSKQAAIAALFKARPDADLVSFRRVAQKNGEFIEDSQGTYYEATLRVAGDFPPPEQEETDAADDTVDAVDDVAKADKDEETADAEGGSDEAPGGPDLAGDGEAKPKKMKPEEEMVSLLRQILHSLQGGAGPAGPGGDADLGDLPDATVGAPPAGGGLPPHGGPGGPPLPPPVPAPKKPGMGGGAFAHVASTESFKFERVEASKMGNRALIIEANQLVPTHKVAKIERVADKAVLTMVKR